MGKLDKLKDKKCKNNKCKYHNIICDFNCTEYGNEIWHRCIDKNKSDLIHEVISRLKAYDNLLIDCIRDINENKSFFLVESERRKIQEFLSEMNKNENLVKKLSD